MALVPFPGKSTAAEARASEDPPAEPSTLTTSPFVGGDPDEDLEPPDGRMSFLEHLDELRKRITRAVVALLAGFLIAFAFIDRITTFVYARLTADIPGGDFIYTEPGEAFFIWIKIAAIAGLLIASPYVMWQVWLFIAPGLYANEKKLAIPFVFFASALFISGVAFSHYILFPLAWKFFASFSNEFVTFTPRIQPVFSLYVKLLLALGIVFQIPMLIFVLARFGMVTARFLLQKFKYAVLIIFIVAAVVTPDGSMVVQVVMAVPMIALYIVSIGVAWLFGKSSRPTE